MIVCLERSGPLQDKIRYKEIRVIEMNKRAGNDIMLPIRLATVLAKEKVCIVHSNNWGTLVECVLAAKWAGIRSVVHTQHGLDYEWGVSRARSRSPLRMVAKRFFARGIKRFAAVSGEVREMLVKEWRIPANRVSVIHNGIPINPKLPLESEREEGRRRLGWTPADFVIGSVGVFRPVKDFPMLIEAVARVIPRAPHARLVLIGDGPSKGEIEGAIDRLGLKPHVHFLGMRSDVGDLLPLLDLFVLSSLSEGVSLAILEAMAAGVPVVATRVGGNREIICEGETGILVSPRSPDETAAAILSFIQDKDRRREVGRRGEGRVRNLFAVDKMARGYEKLYSEIGY